MSTPAMQISSYSFQDSHYPDLLREINNPPKNLNILGELPRGIYIAIVGSRKPTAYGEQITYQFASELAKAGAIIVSGLAIGVDGIAHRAAVEAGGKTVAVLAHGLSQIYPTQHRNLAKEILATGGALVTEYDAKEEPLKHHFIERNRIIAGLSVATIVTESTQKSGSLFTANYAKDSNRIVMAVPGNITSAFSAGPNSLIRQGAEPITSATDVIVTLGFEARETTPVSAQSPEEARVIELINQGINTNQTLIEATGLTAAKFANIISLMEITGKVRNLGAGVWAQR